MTHAQRLVGTCRRSRRRLRLLSSLVVAGALTFASEPVALGAGPDPTQRRQAAGHEVIASFGTVSDDHDGKPVLADPTGELPLEDGVAPTAVQDSARRSSSRLVPLSRSRALAAAPAARHAARPPPPCRHRWLR
jgi:hypothetical protein